MDKHDRYRHKQILKGCCPHCGKLCAPYYECEERRESKNFRRCLNHMTQIGTIIKRQTNPWEPASYQINSIQPTLSKSIRYGYMNQEGDRRKWPRIGKKYFSLEDIANMGVEVLTEVGHSLSINKITKLIFRKIAIMKEISLR